MAKRKTKDIMTVADLKPDRANRRRHNERNLGMVVDALQQVGAARSIVIDEDGVILAGNGVAEAAAQAGITKVRVIEANGQELIAVRRSGLTEEQKRTLAIYDNRTGELSEWNIDQLKSDAIAGVDLKPFFTEKEQAGMLGLAGAEECAEPIYKSEWMIVVSCSGENHQLKLLKRFLSEGLECRAVNS